MKRIGSIIRLLVTAALSLLVLDRLPYPFVWVFLLWAVVSLLFAIRTVRHGTRIVAVNGCLIASIFLALEVVLWVKPNLGREKPIAPEITTVGRAVHGFRIYDKELGYRPEANKTGVSTKTWRDEVLFDMTCTIDSNRTRINPPPRDPNAPAILFFGCSYTFGEGVNDEEAAPYRVAVKSDYAYKAFNFGVPGYGSHQMLAALEFGIVEDVIKNAEPEIIIYQGIDFHADRCAGRAFWDLDGPWYERDDQEGVRHMGTFRDRHELTPIRNFFESLLEKSSTAVRLLPLKSSYKVTPEDIDLMVRIIVKSRDISQTKFPKADFHVIFWDEYSRHAPVIMQKIRDAGIPVHVVSEFAPEINARSDIYRFSKDWHPNPKAHELIATYVVDHIINK